MQISVALDGEKRRDLRFYPGDDTTITVVVYAVDGDTVPLAITNEQFAFGNWGVLPVDSSFVASGCSRREFRIVGDIAGITTTLAYGIAEIGAGVSMSDICCADWDYGSQRGGRAFGTPAENVHVLDAGEHFVGDDVEEVLSELWSMIARGDLALGAQLNLSSSNVFADDAARDAYFVLNPSELLFGTFVVSDSVFQMYGTDWNDVTAVIRGPAGVAGLVDLTTDVTGLLPVTNGGTGTASPSIVAGTNITVTGTWPNQTVNSTASGSGDVTGPASSVNNRVAFFNGTTGKLIKDSGLALSGANTGDQDLSGLQPLDSDLTAIAALSTTSFGRALLALADAAAGRTAIGLGTLATQSGTFSGTSSGTNTGDQTSVSGNAGTATALATARSIYGNSFDGTGNVTGNLVATSTSVNGMAGAGFVELTPQSSAPATPAANTCRLFADSSGRLSWKGANGFVRTFDGTSNTADRMYMLPDVAGTLALLGAQTFTGLQTINVGAIGAVSTDGLLLANTTAAAAGAQQWGPRLRHLAQGWKTTATAASQSIEWIQELQPVQGTTAPTGNLVFSSQVNAGGYTAQLSMAAGSTLQGLGSTNGGLLLQGSATTGVGLEVAGSTVIGRTSVSSTLWAINSAGSGQGTFMAASGGSLSWSSSSTSVLSSTDTFISRGAAATIQLGTANAASPVAQTLRSQGSRPGTDSNVGGGNFTIQAAAGTGTGAISSLILQSPLVVASGTGVQTQTTGLTIKAGTAVLASYTVATLPAAATAGAGATAFVTDASTTLVLGLGGAVVGGGANKVPVYSDGTNWIIG